MKRLLKSWVFWVFIVVPTAVTLACFTYRYRRFQLSSNCFSERVVTQWRFGVEGKWSVPLLPRSEEMLETRVHLDGWLGAHEHVSSWVVTRTGPRRVYDGTDGLLAAYETNAAFRAFMLAKRERGEVALQDFVAELTPFFLMFSGNVTGRQARFEDWWREFERVRPFP